MKYASFLLLSLTVSTLSPSGDWQLWLSESKQVRPAQDVQVHYTNEIRFFNDFQTLSYYHFEPLFLHRIFKDNYAGIQARLIWQRSSDGDWGFEFRPGIVFLYKIDLGKRDLGIRVKIKDRIRRGREGHIANRNRFSMDLIKLPKDIVFYLSEEFYYNHNNIRPHQLDRNRLIAGFKGKIDKINSWGAYFLWQENKSGSKRAWKPTYVIGASYKAKF